MFLPARTESCAVRSSEKRRYQNDRQLNRRRQSSPSYSACSCMGFASGRRGACLNRKTSTFAARDGKMKRIAVHLGSDPVAEAVHVLLAESVQPNQPTDPEWTQMVTDRLGIDLKALGQRLDVLGRFSESVEDPKPQFVLEHRQHIDNRFARRHFSRRRPSSIPVGHPYSPLLRWRLTSHTSLVYKRRARCSSCTRWLSPIRFLRMSNHHPPLLLISDAMRICVSTIPQIRLATKRPSAR